MLVIARALILALVCAWSSLSGLAAAEAYQGSLSAKLAAEGRSGTVELLYTNPRSALLKVALSGVKPRAYYSVQILGGPCSAKPGSLWTRDFRSTSAGKISASAKLPAWAATAIYQSPKVSASATTFPCTAMKTVVLQKVPPGLPSPPAQLAFDESWPLRDVVPVLFVTSDQAAGEAALTADAAAIDRGIQAARDFFADQLGGRTFVATPVRTVTAPHDLGFYGFAPGNADPFGSYALEDAIETDLAQFGLAPRWGSGRIVATFVRGAPGFVSRGGSDGAMGGRAWFVGGAITALSSTEPAAFAGGVHLVSHELGHAFGLLHPEDYGGDTSASVMGTNGVGSGLTAAERFDLLAGRKAAYMQATTAVDMTPSATASSASTTTVSAPTGALERADGVALGLAAPFRTTKTTVEFTLGPVARTAAHLMVRSLIWGSTQQWIDMAVWSAAAGAWMPIPMSSSTVETAWTAVFGRLAGTAADYLPAGADVGSLRIRASTMPSAQPWLGTFSSAWDTIAVSYDLEQDPPLPALVARVATPSVTASIGTIPSIDVVLNLDPAAARLSAWADPAGGGAPKALWCSTAWNVCSLSSESSDRPETRTYRLRIVDQHGAALWDDGPVTIKWQAP